MQGAPRDAPAVLVPTRVTLAIQAITSLMAPVQVLLLRALFITAVIAFYGTHIHIVKNANKMSTSVELVGKQNLHNKLLL